MRVHEAEEREDGYYFEFCSLDSSDGCDYYQGGTACRHQGFHIQADTEAKAEQEAADQAKALFAKLKPRKLK